MRGEGQVAFLRWAGTQNAEQIDSSDVLTLGLPDGAGTAEGRAALSPKFELGIPKLPDVKN